MINEYKGDSHFDPSGGIGLANAIVEDGELEFKGYIFSKDSEENKKLKREQKIRAIRTNKDDDYVWDKISRDSLNRAAIPLVESHEANRMNKLMADLELAEQGLDEAGIPSQGDMSLDSSQMGELPIMAAGGFTPTVTTNQQYDDSFIDPSLGNPNASTGNMSGVGSKSRAATGAKTAGMVANYAGVAANAASQFLPENPYPDKGKEVGVMQSTGDSIAGSVVPFYNETKSVAALGTGLRNQGIKDDNSALEVTGSTIEGIDQFGSRMKSIDMADKGIITEEENAGIQVLDFFVPFLGNNLLNDREKTYYENKAKQDKIKGVLDNRDFGGTEMTAVTPRNRNTMGYGGFKENKQIMACGGKKKMGDGGDKPKLSSLDLNFLTGQPRQENAKPPYIYNSYDNTFDMNQNLPTMMQPLSQNNNTSSTPNNVPQITANVADVKPTYSVSGNATGPNTPMSMIGDDGKKKIDWGNIAETTAMGLLGNVGNLAFLANEGKDYDKVDYGSFTPEMVNTSSSRRAIRDSIATSKEALKETGKLDRASMALLGTQGAKQYADAEERIRLANTGMFNDAQLKNIDINMASMRDEAANKGQALTNYYNALNALGQNTQAAGRGYNLRTSDAEKQRLVNENNARLKEWIASLA